MAATKIEWTDETWNPLRARHRQTGKVGHYCEMVSPGCAHCYASALQRRFGLPSYGGPVGREGRRQDLELFLDKQVLKQPLHWKKPRRVFVCSMTDLFGAWVSDDDIDDVFRAMWKSPQHHFQVLTKRADRLHAHCSKRWGRFGGAEFQPAPNVWLGVSVEDQARADERIPLLLQTPAAVRFLSCEPLIAPVELDISRWGGCYHDGYRGRDHEADHGECACYLDWCIIGGESGPDARPCDLTWVRSLVEQCKAAGVACFVKQLGANITGFTDSKGLSHDFIAKALGATYRLRDPKGGNPAEWPQDLQIREFPKEK